jgi:hypothetical protein
MAYLMQSNDAAAKFRVLLHEQENWRGERLSHLGLRKVASLLAKYEAYGEKR